MSEFIDWLFQKQVQSIKKISVIQPRPWPFVLGQIIRFLGREKLEFGIHICNVFCLVQMTYSCFYLQDNCMRRNTGFLDHSKLVSSLGEYPNMDQDAIAMGWLLKIICSIYVVLFSTYDTGPQAQFITQFQFVNNNSLILLYCLVLSQCY